MQEHSGTERTNLYSGTFKLHRIQEHRKEFKSHFQIHEHLRHDIQEHSGAALYLETLILPQIQKH